MSAGRGGPVGWIHRHSAPLRGDGRGWVLATVAGGWFLTLGMRFVVPALLPAVKRTFAVGNTGVGFAVTIIWLTYAGMQLPAGALIDRIGERVLLTVSLLVAGTSLVMFLAPTFALFLIASAVFGIGTGLFGPSRGVVLSNTYEEDGAAFGITLAAGSIGAAALPFVATQFSLWTTWQVAIAVFAPLFGLLGVGVWRAVPERRTGTRGGSRAGRLRAVGAAVTDRRVLIAVAGVLFMLFTFQGLTAFFTTYLVEVKGLDGATAGGLFALLFVSGAAFQSVAGRAADRVGHRPVLVGACLLGIPPLVALPLVDGFLPLTAASALIGLRMGVGPVTNSYVLGALPGDVRGTAWGLLRTAFFGIGATGSVAVGALADAGLFDAAVFGLAALTVPSVLAFLALPPRG